MFQISEYIVKDNNFCPSQKSTEIKYKYKYVTGVYVNFET